MHKIMKKTSAAMVKWMNDIPHRKTWINTGEKAAPMVCEVSWQVCCTSKM